MNTLWLTLGSILLGLIFGSFLNVVIHRLPIMIMAFWKDNCLELFPEIAPKDACKHESFNLFFPASQCPKCKNPIKLWHNIPILSFLFLKGQCAYCHDKISWRYPLTELSLALLWLINALHFGCGWPLLGANIFCFFGVALFWIDWDHQLLLDQLTLPLLWVGLLFNISHQFSSLSYAVIGAVAGYLFFWLMYWLFKLVTSKEGLGYGDFKLLAALGAWLGWPLLPVTVTLAAGIGLITALLLRLTQGTRASREFPFGPALVIAGWVMLLWGSYFIA